MATAKQRAWRAKFASLYGRKTTKARPKRAGGNMARRNYGRIARRYGRRAVSYARSDFLGSALEGMGVSVLGSKFLGRPIGQYSGAAYGALYGFVRKRNILATAAGGFAADMVGSNGSSPVSGGWNF